MPFTILKISPSKPKEVEVIGEFGTEVEANAFVLGVRTEDPESEYIVEAPPAPRDPLAQHS
jgi:hypothetical protein